MLPTAGRVTKEGGEITGADGGENVPPKLGCAGGDGIMGVGIGGGATIGSVI